MLLCNAYYVKLCKILLHLDSTCYSTVHMMYSYLEMFRFYAILPTKLRYPSLLYIYLLLFYIISDLWQRTSIILVIFFFFNFRRQNICGLDSIARHGFSYIKTHKFSNMLNAGNTNFCPH